MAFDIVVIGSASVDVLVKTDARTIRIQGVSHNQVVDEQLLAYPLGSKLLIQQLVFCPGGAGTNVCATFAVLGLRTAFIGRLGNDSHGQMLLDWLHEHDVTFLGGLGGATGYSLILASPVADDRTILSFKGCNDELDFAPLPATRWQTRWLYGTSMLEASFAVQERLFAYAHEHGIHTAYNPNPYLCCQGLNVMRDMLRHSEVLMLNREEASLLVGAVSEPSALAKRLAAHGPGVVAVTDGARGATVYASSRWGDGCWHVQPATDLAIVDVTGAGDAFGSGLVAGLHLGKPVREAALLGVLNAESVIQVYGAKPPPVSRALVEERLRAEALRPRHLIAEL